MDRYTKIVLTGIAVALILIAAKLWEPQPVHGGFLANGPTVGDLYKRMNSQEKRDLIYRIPLVRVYGQVEIEKE